MPAAVVSVTRSRYRCLTSEGSGYQLEMAQDPQVDRRDDRREETPGEDRDVGAVVQAAVEAVGKTGQVSLSAVADAVESAARALTHRMVAGAVSQPRPVADQRDLAAALANRPAGPTLGGATTAAFAVRAARRFGPLRFLTKRTPMWLVAAAVPALYSSVTRGADELGLVASHLVLRARAAGIEPDPERLDHVAVQVVLGAAVDPDAEPRHGQLVVKWLRRAGRAALPFTAGVATAHPKELAANAARVPLSALRPASAER